MKDLAERIFWLFVGTLTGVIGFGILATVILLFSGCTSPNLSPCAGFAVAMARATEQCAAMPSCVKRDLDIEGAAKIREKHPECFVRRST